MNNKYLFTYVQEPTITICLPEVLAVEISSSTIEKMIVEGLEWMKRNNDQSMWFSMTGNTLVAIIRDEEELQIEVTERKRSGYVRL